MSKTNGQSGLNYNISNKNGFGKVEISLRKGETVFAEPGAMMWMDSTVKVETTTRGGIFSGVKRLFSNEDFFQNHFTGPGKVNLALGSLPGDMIALKVTPGKSFVLSKGSFVAATDNIEVTTGFRLRAIAANTPFLVKVQVAEGSNKPGIVFIGAYGGVEHIKVQKGKELILDNGNFLGIDEDKDFTITTFGKAKSFFFGGEGLVFRVRGPANVITRSRDPFVLFKEIKREVVPKKR